MTPASRNLALRLDVSDALDVRRFAIEQRMSSLFEVTLTALSDDADIDFDAVVGRPASFRMHGGAQALVPFRFWTGLCKHAQQVAVEETGLSTYEITIVPTLWLATQRRNHRMFQQLSELDIARKLLAEWGIEPELRIAGTYRKREYRVQYAESDYAFLCRMLEDAGISFFFEQGDTETRLVLTDAPQSVEARPSIPFRDNPTTSLDREYVTKLHVGQQVRPGRYTLRDHDTRLAASYPLLADARAPGAGVEGRLERFHYTPGAFLFGTDQGDDQPHGDDKGKTRSDEREGGALARKRLEAKRSSAKACSFETNVADLAPGVVTAVLDHPRSDVAGKPLLVIASSIRGDSHGEWTHRCEARRADVAYRPRLATRKPRISGVESATVVGPAGEEIHTDELGRVRVHFHWDRESRMDQNSSCWIHTSQPWGGAGYGGTNLPRVGQEVLVDFLGGDPDRPIITGRVYTSLQKTPYTLPGNKTQSGWKSSSSPQTGGYNEIMFEDAAGRELVRMQAERDLHKLVKHDEEVTIGHDRTKLVEHDDALTVGNDRTKIVQNDEDVTIGNDRTKLVKNDDALTVGNSRTKMVQMNERAVVGMNRTRTVGINESVEIGADHTVTVGADHSVKVGANQSVKVGSNQSVSVGGAHSSAVALVSAETIGLAKTLTIGGAYAVTVGGAMNTTVTGVQAEEVGLFKTVTVGAKIEVTCGKAKMVLDASGKVTIEGTEIDLKAHKIVLDTGAEATITMEGSTITQVAGKLSATGNNGVALEAKAGNMLIKGSPMVDINPDK
jgi:type VI secretion system secreted protein VgrG